MNFTHCIRLIKKPTHGRFFAHSRNALTVWFAIAAWLPLVIPNVALGEETWTLERVVDRFLEVAPEGQIFAAEIQASRGALQQAGQWPNPQIELRADDRLGQEDGNGGVDLTQFSVSQPIPLSGRLAREIEVAEAELKAVSTSKRYQRLLLEARAARLFHTLQLSVATLKLAEERLTLADILRDAGRRRARAGELADLARLRLDIIREFAKQVIDRAEGTYNESLTEFRTVLNLTTTLVPNLVPLSPYGPIPTINELEAELLRHPAVSSANTFVEAARSDVALKRSERWPDPELKFFRERDFLGSRRENVTGVGIGITIPLWDLKSGRIHEARARESEARAKVQVVNRDLASLLRKSHLHLTRLVHQTAEYREKILGPANKLLDLTRKSYAVGEAEILSLIDANNTYFDSRTRYLELLQEAWLEAADLRVAAGLSISTRKEGVVP